jgi:hypothetical protein
MRTGVTVYLSPTDRKRLQAIVDDRNSPQKHVWRAQIVLATGDGLGTATIMRTAGVSKTAVWRWQAHHGQLVSQLTTKQQKIAQRVPPGFLCYNWT